VIDRKKPALPDAAEWDGVPDKLRLLIRSAIG
jgi:ferredoxin